MQNQSNGVSYARKNIRKSRIRNPKNGIESKVNGADFPSVVAHTRAIAMTPTLLLSPRQDVLRCSGDWCLPETRHNLVLQSFPKTTNYNNPPVWEVALTIELRSLNILWGLEICTCTSSFSVEATASQNTSRRQNHHNCFTRKKCICCHTTAFALGTIRCFFVHALAVILSLLHHWKHPLLLRCRLDCTFPLIYPTV